MSGPWLTTSDALMHPGIGGGDIVVPAGTPVIDACRGNCHLYCVMDGDEVLMVASRLPPTELTPACRICLRDNGQYTATDYEAMDGTPCCESCERYVEADAKQRRIDEHEGAAEDALDLRRDR